MFKKMTATLAAVAVGTCAVLVAGFLWSGGASAVTVKAVAGAEGGTSARVEVPILMYHYVDEAPPENGPAAPSLTISPQQFEAEMDYLAGNGFHPVTIADVYAATQGTAELPAKPVAITFDDGGADCYSVAYPILREHGFTATFFVITGYVGNGSCMTWDQLREMRAAGMDIESHTYSHPDLRKLDAARLAQELRESRAALVRELGASACFLSYPEGRFDGRVVAAAKAAGYLAAVRTRSLWGPLASDSRYEWQRTNIKPGMSLPAFAKALEPAR